MENKQKIEKAFNDNVQKVYLRTFDVYKNERWESFQNFKDKYFEDLDWLKEDNSWIATNYTDIVVNYLNNLPNDMVIRFPATMDNHLPNPFDLVARAINAPCNN